MTDRIVILFTLVIATSFSACATAPEPTAELPPAGDRSVSLAYEIDVSSDRIGVGVGIEGPAGEEIRLGVPGSYGAAKELHLLRDVMASDSGGNVLDLESDGHWWRVTIPADGRLEFAYEVRTDAEAHGLTDRDPGGGEMPVLAEDHVFFLTGLVLVAPEEEEALTTPIPVSWRLPEGWEVASPFGKAAPSLKSLKWNYVAAGASSSTRVEVTPGFDITMVWLGEGHLAKAPAPGEAARVLRAGVQLMGGEAPTDHYLIIVRPDLRAGSFEASPKVSSIQMHSPSDLPLESLHTYGPPWDPMFLRLLAHEYFHSWQGEPGPAPDRGDGPEAGGQLRWFGEGFVEYLARLSLLRSGVIDTKQFLRGVTQVHARLENNPYYGSKSMVEVSGTFFEDTNARQFAYDAGMIAAFLADLHLRAQGDGTLLDFLRTLPPGTSRLTLDYVLQKWEAHSGQSGPLAQWVKSAEKLPMKEVIERAGGRLVERESYFHDARIEEREGEAIVTSAGPNAHTQGLREGDVVVAVASDAVKTPADFYQQLTPDGVEVTVRRGREDVKLTAALVPKKEFEIVADSGSLLEQMGGNAASGGP